MPLMSIEASGVVLISVNLSDDPDTSIVDDADIVKPSCACAECIYTPYKGVAGDGHGGGGDCGTIERAGVVGAQCAIGVACAEC